MFVRCLFCRSRFGSGRFFNLIVSARVGHSNIALHFFDSENLISTRLQNLDIEQNFVTGREAFHVEFLTHRIGHSHCAHEAGNRVMLDNEHAVLNFPNGAMADIRILRRPVRLQDPDIDP